MDIPTSNIILDGVKFKVSEELKVKHQCAGSNVHIKDIHVLLQKNNYDFSIEKHLIHMQELKRKEIEEEKIRKEKKKLLPENSPQSSNNHDENKAKQQCVNNKNDPKTAKMSENLSITNPFLNDIFGNDILTPQKYTNVQQDDSDPRKRVDVHEFEDENLDPFSNAELQTIDDLKELKDVLQNVTMGLSVTSNAPPKAAPRVRRHSLTDKSDEVNVKITKRQEEAISDMKTRSNLSLIENAPSSTSTVQLLPNLRRSTDDLATPMDISSTNVLSSATSLPTMAPLSDMNEESSLPSHQASKTNCPASVTPDEDFVSSSSNVASGYDKDQNLHSSEASSSMNRHSPVVHYSASLNDVDFRTEVPVSEEIDVPKNDYVNISSNKPKPAVLPKPVTKPHSTPTSTATSVNHAFPTASSASMVENKVLANKSKEERAKFEETINKALTSLPTLPNITFSAKNSASGCKSSFNYGLTTASKKSSNNSSSSSTGRTALKVSSASTASILSGLSATERGFAEPLIAMGFKEEDVIRSMQKCDKDQKEVLDHLIKVQCLSEKGFSIENIEDALDIFQGDLEEAAKYLTLERQFLDMGFPCSKVKEALILHNTDQTKALEELMSGV